MNRTWSTEQQSIFKWFQNGAGNLVVKARAGTGKTTTIVESFSHAPEARICYVVFNKKNQIEAQGKISDPRVEVKTLHALGYSYIRARWPRCTVDARVEYDRIRQAASDGKVYDLPSDVVIAVAQLVGLAKNRLIDPTFEDLAQLAQEFGVDPGEEYEGRYPLAFLSRVALDALHLATEPDEQGRISFDDMVWLPVHCGWVTPRFDLVVVDEAQDMNICQLTMARRAVRSRGRVCVVGDDRQAIYGFRGAEQDGLGLMREELNAQVLGLTTTYRCPRKVVEIAQRIVSDYVAAPSAPEGIVDCRIEGSILGTAVPGDAILSRTNAPLMPLCLSFLRQGLPARIEGRDVGKAMANIVKKLNGRSVPDLLEKARRWMCRKIKRAIAASGDDGSAQCEMVRDQFETIAAVADGCASVAEVIRRFETMFEDSEGQRKPCIVLSTVHKAKGLEWDHVYLLQDSFRRGTEGEEANIYYVAVTRSKAHLTIVQK